MQNTNKPGNTEREQFMQTLKKGDALLCETPKARFVCFLKEIRGNKASYYASIYNRQKAFFTESDFHPAYIRRIATQKEINILLEAIDQNGYQWDASTCTLSLKKENNQVPDTINLLKLTVCLTSEAFGDGLAIGNPETTKLLIVRDDSYTVIDNNQHLFVKVKCRIEPCQYTDLKHGDTAYMGGNYSDPCKLFFYAKILKEGYAYFNNNTAYHGYNTDYQWYKVIPE